MDGNGELVISTHCPIRKRFGSSNWNNHYLKRFFKATKDQMIHYTLKKSKSTIKEIMLFWKIDNYLSRDLFHQ